MSNIVKIQMKCFVCDKVTGKYPSNVAKYKTNITFCSNKCKFSYRKNKTWEEFLGVEGAQKQREERASRKLLTKENCEWRKRASDKMKGRHVIKEKHGEECSCWICRFQRGEIKGKEHPCYGIEHTEEFKQEASERLKGSNHWNWKGGVSSLDRRIYTLHEYKNWIQECLKKDNHKCQECNINENLEVHHIKHFNEILQEFLQLYNQFSPIEDKETLVRLASKYEPFWEIKNGKTLCYDCHNNVHTKIVNLIKEEIK